MSSHWPVRIRGYRKPRYLDLNDDEQFGGFCNYDDDDFNGMIKFVKEAVGEKYRLGKGIKYIRFNENDLIKLLEHLDDCAHEVSWDPFAYHYDDDNY